LSFQNINKRIHSIATPAEMTSELASLKSEINQALFDAGNDPDRCLLQSCGLKPNRGHTTNHTFDAGEKPLARALQTSNGLTLGEYYTINLVNTVNGKAKLTDLSGSNMGMKPDRGSLWEIQKETKDSFPLINYYINHTARELFRKLNHFKMTTESSAMRLRPAVALELGQTIEIQSDFTLNNIPFVQGDLFNPISVNAGTDEIEIMIDGSASTAESIDDLRLHNSDGYFLLSDVGRQIVGMGTGGGQTSRGLADGQNYTIDSVFSEISGTPYYEKARIANPSDVDGAGAGSGILLWKHKENQKESPFWGFVYSDQHSIDQRSTRFEVITPLDAGFRPKTISPDLLL
jgi:hypothetical protein